MKPVPVLYLDLDGTVRKGPDELDGKFVNAVKDVEVFPAALERMKQAKEQGWRIVAVTNQGGVSMGFMDYQTAQLIQLETNTQCEGLFDHMMMCVHHPDAEDPEFRVCWCRKPRAGMVIEAAIAMGQKFDEYYPPHMALFIGDREEDRLCADAANIQFIDAKKWRGKE